MILLSVSLTSYAQGNPEPNLKYVHMHMVHGDYTLEEAEKHPDFDCETFTKGFKTQPIEFFQSHIENGRHRVDIRYLNGTYSQHYFDTRKEVRILRKEARKWQKSIKEIINERIRSNISS